MASSVSPKKLEISFGGGGFLGVYHAGVVKCVKDHAPHLLDELEGFYGASSGAITAVCAASLVDPLVPYKWVKKTFEASRKYRLLGTLHPSFDLSRRVREFLEESLPPNAHKLARKKVWISLTTFSPHGLNNWLVSNFTTRKELIDATVASCSFPGYAGITIPPKFRGKRCCDGGISSNIPRCHNPNIITVSPFSGECDICPQGESYSPHIQLVDQPFQVSARNVVRVAKALVPKSWADLDSSFYSGYKDAYRFFKVEGIVSEAVIRPVRRASMPLPLTENGTVPIDNTSDYFSHYSDTTSFRRSHRRSLSITVSTNGDFFSCIDEDEEEEEERKGAVAKVPSYLRSLGQEMEQIVNEMEAVNCKRSEEKEKMSHRWTRLHVGSSVIQQPPAGMLYVIFYLFTAYMTLYMYTYNV